jgi:hypothetical protein
MISTPVRDRELRELVEALDRANEVLDRFDFDYLDGRLVLPLCERIAIQSAIGQAADVLIQFRFKGSDR